MLLYCLLCAVTLPGESAGRQEERCSAAGIVCGVERPRSRCEEEAANIIVGLALCDVGDGSCIHVCVGAGGDFGRFIDEHKKKEQLDRQRRRLRWGHGMAAAADGDAEAMERVCVPKHAAGMVNASRARAWFSPVFNMVGPKAKWPVTEEHLKRVTEPFLEPAAALKAKVLDFLVHSGRIRAATAMRSVWCASRACLAYISSFLGASSTKDMPCPSFVEGVELAKAHRDELRGSCGQEHPGICQTLHACEYAAALKSAKVLAHLHKPSDEETACRFLVFDCLSAKGRLSVFLWKIGGTSLSTAPRTIFLLMRPAAQALDVFPNKDEVETAEEGCKVPVHRRPGSVELPASVCVEFCMRMSPRLKLEEPVHCTQFSLAFVLHKMNPPASSWKCLTPESEVWQGKCVQLQNLRELAVWEQAAAPAAAPAPAVSISERLEKMSDDDELDANMLESLTAQRAAKRRQGNGLLPPVAAGGADDDAALLASLEAKPRKKGCMWKDIVSDDSDVSSGGFSVSSDSSDGVRKYISKTARGQARKAAAAKVENAKKRRAAQPRAGGAAAAPAPAPGPAPAEAPGPVVPVAGPAAPPPPPPLAPNFVFRLGYTYVQVLQLGWICFSEKNLNAHCGHHQQMGAKCHCDRLRGGYSAGGAGGEGGGGKRAGQGRPLGLLMLWLTKASDFADHSGRECKRLLGSAAFHPERAAARQALKQLPNTAQFFAAERPQREGEEEEPLVVPG